MLTLKNINRFQAFAVHLGVSLVIFLILAALIFFYWFPGVLRIADPNWQTILLLIAGVDLVLGPALTLIVFNPQKKSLKADLSVIALLQTAALVYGVYSVHTTRPLALYLSFPAAGVEVLYNDKIQPELKDYLNQNPALLYIDAGDQLFGKSSENLEASDLLSTPSPGFAEFMNKRKGVDFENESGYQIPVGLNNPYQLNLSEQGELLNWQLAEKQPISSIN